MRLATGILLESMRMTVVSGQKSDKKKKAASDYVEWISQERMRIMKGKELKL